MEENKSRGTWGGAHTSRYATIDEKTQRSILWDEIWRIEENRGA